MTKTLIAAHNKTGANSTFWPLGQTAELEYVLWEIFIYFLLLFNLI